MNANTVYVDTSVWIPKALVSIDGVKRALTFTFTERETTRMVELWRETDDHLGVPRALWDLRTFPCRAVDLRPQHYVRTGITSRIQLDHKKERSGNMTTLVPTGRTLQQEAVAALMRAPGGLLQLSCGLGKTVIALETIARLQVPALIIVDTTQLILQWGKEIDALLDVPDGVGLIQGDKQDWRHSIVLATYQTLAARAETLPQELRNWFGVIIWDEIHHLSAPVFCQSADLFPGRRYGLTATPTRADGTHVIYQYHIGPVLLKDLTAGLKTTIKFRWVGLTPTDKQVKAATDVRGETNLSRLSGVYGAWPERLLLLINDIREAVERGRKVLVLSVTIDEAVNLLTVWTRGYPTTLYTDIPQPTASDVGSTLIPLYLKKAKEQQFYEQHARLQNMLTHARTSEQSAIQQKLQTTEQTIKRIELGRQLTAEWSKRKHAFIQQLMQDAKHGGLMTYAIPPKERDKRLQEQPVTFAIMKYGKEALDCQALDTILVSLPFTDRNWLQQVLGRPARPDNRKQSPLVVIYEDSFGPSQGMCKKLRRHIHDWPLEDGGPYQYFLVGHPYATGNRKAGLFC